MISELQKHFPHIPEKALKEIVKILLIRLKLSLTYRGIMEPKVIYVKGLGTFHVGNKVDKKRHLKAVAKRVKKHRRKHKVKPVPTLLSLLST